MHFSSLRVKLDQGKAHAERDYRIDCPWGDHCSSALAIESVPEVCLPNDLLLATGCAVPKLAIVIVPVIALIVLVTATED